MGGCLSGGNEGGEIKTENQDIKLFKVCISGKTTVGKTSLILQYVESIFLEGDIQMNDEFKEKLVNVDKSTSVKLQIHDTGGTEKFREITVSYYRGAQAVIIVFSIADKSSFDDIDNWYKDIEKFAPGAIIFIVGNKSDLPRVVSEEDAKKKAIDLDARYFEVSAKTKNGVNQLFDEVAKTLFEEKRI